MRRPRRIRFGSWLVAERAPFPPWVFTSADADSVLSRLPPMRNEARLREIVEDYRSGKVPTARPDERDSPDLDPRNELLRQIAFPWALIAGFAVIHALGARVDAPGVKGYGGLVSGAVLATLYCALRIWDERHRDVVVVPPGPSLARLARWNLGLAFVAAVALILWIIRHR